MGLISGLLTLPLAPLRGTVWVLEKVAEQAEAELYDEGNIRRQLEELQLAFEMGEIGEKEFEESEDELLERLEVARERREAELQMQQEFQAEPSEPIDTHELLEPLEIAGETGQAEPHQDGGY